MKLYRLILSAIFMLSCSTSDAKDSLSKKAKLSKISEMTTKIDAKFGVPKIKAATLDKWLEKKGKDEIVLVDVREPKEMEESMIAGAITKAEYFKNKKKYQGKKIVAYCTIGYRSSIFVKDLKKDGQDAYNLVGSILSWAHHGGKIVDSKGKGTKKVNVYGKSWDYLPAGYQSTFNK